MNVYSPLLYITVACSSVKQPWRLILKLFYNPAFSLIGKSPYTWQVMVCALQVLLCHMKSMYVVVIVLDRPSAHLICVDTDREQECCFSQLYL